MQPVITERKYSINYYDVDYKKRALISSILNFFSDVALYQSEVLNIGFDYLQQNNLMWVISKYNININRHPMYGETITIKTKPLAFRKFYAFRTFEVLDSNNESIITADSLWMLLDSNKRKPVTINEYLTNTYRVANSLKNSIKFDKIPDITTVDCEKKFNVRYSDIDTNQHVNNVKYYSWAIESVPTDIVLNYTLCNVKIFYKKETTYGEVIKVLTEINNTDDTIICIHKIIDNNGEELTRLQTTWIKE